MSKLYYWKGSEGEEAYLSKEEIMENRNCILWHSFDKETDNKLPLSLAFNPKDDRVKYIACDACHEETFCVHISCTELAETAELVPEMADQYTCDGCLQHL